VSLENILTQLLSAGISGICAVMDAVVRRGETGGSYKVNVSHCLSSFMCLPQLYVVFF
jgi:hypothetical protein